SITTWEDLTTRFLAQFFPPGRTAKLCNDILMFQQHHGESLSEAWTHFKDLLQKFSHHGIDLWLQVQICYDHVNPVTRRTIDQSNDPRDFAKPVKAISLPQDVSSTSDRRLIKLENQVQCLMEAHLALTQPTQLNKITTSCEICSGPHDTQYCMEDPEQAFVEYASSCTNEARGKCYTFKSEQNNLGDIYNPSWESHLNLRRPFIEIECLAINRKHGLMTFTDETKEITFKTPYKDLERSELSIEGHDLLSSRVILSEDDFDIGCRKPSDLEDGFYRDTIKLGPAYLTGIDDEGEVTLYLTRRSLEVLRKFHRMILRGRINQLSYVSSSLLSKPEEY
nr:MAK10-like protein [Tanacetum cinerariifolium]GEY63821.1 MAK10-like protein [Tanacetum cinerariifolium]